MKTMFKAVLIATTILTSLQTQASWRVEQSVNKYTGDAVVRMTDYASKSIWFECTSLTFVRLTIEFPGYLRREGLGKILWTTGEQHGLLEMNEHNLDSWIIIKDINETQSVSDVSLYSDINHSVKDTKNDPNEKLISAMKSGEIIEFKTEGYHHAEYQQQAQLAGFSKAWSELEQTCKEVHVR